MSPNVTRIPEVAEAKRRQFGRRGDSPEAGYPLLGEVHGVNQRNII